MPVRIRKTRGGGQECYAVSTPSGTKAKCTTKAKAEAQKRIIEAADRKRA